MAELNYVQMMRESLEKKIRILEEIRLLNREQNQILQDDNATPDQFDDKIDKKQKLIDQLTGLDNGFQQMYNRVREALHTNRAAYADEIRKMQMYIREITDLSATIQAQEKRNKQLAETKFSNIRSKAKEVRKSQKAVNTYYKTMMDRNYVDPQFYDSKK
jgi:flagellar biosynthesis/type III secretory pathway chaperone